MAKATTKQVEESENKGIVLDVSVRTLHEFLYEDDDGVTKERKLLDKVYEKGVVEGDNTMLKLLFDKMFPNAKTDIDLTSGGRTLALQDIMSQFENPPEAKRK